MTKLAKWTALILVVLLVPATAAALLPAAAVAQAEEEYDLDLPGSGGDQTTPANSTPTDTSGVDDDGGFPVLGIVLFAAAGVAVGLALWRLAVGRRLEEAGEPPDDSS